MRRISSAPEPDQAPPVDWPAYEEFAREALTVLSAGDDPDAQLLRAQLSDATLDEMEYTGVGVFLKLVVRECAAPLSRSGVIGDVHAEAADSNGPLGLLLFVENGVATMLEAFAYVDWPDDIRSYSCRYVRWAPQQDGTGSTAENVAIRDPSSMWSG